MGNASSFVNKSLKLYAHYTVMIGNKLYAYANRAPALKVIENSNSPSQQIQVTQLASPNTPRSEPSIVHCDGNIYVIGGKHVDI